MHTDPSYTRDERPTPSAAKTAINQTEYVDVKGLAAITGISASAWNKRRLTGDTPPFTKIGKSVRYHIPTVREWMNERMRRSTSDSTVTAM